METTTSLVRGLDTPNITRRMMFSETVLLLILIIGMIVIPIILIGSAIIAAEDTFELLWLIPIVISLIPWGMLLGVLIFLLVSSFRARKEVFLLAKNNDYTALEDILSLEDFVGQHKMKQIDLFKMKYAIAVLGDLQLVSSLKYLIDIMFCPKSLSWSLRRWSAFAIAKIGTIEAVQALTKARSLFKNPSNSMYPQLIIHRPLSILLRRIHPIRANLAVKRSLGKLKKLNGIIEKE